MCGGINTGSKVSSCSDPLSWFITYCISRAAVPEPDLHDPTVTPGGCAVPHGAPWGREAGPVDGGLLHGGPGVQGPGAGLTAQRALGRLGRVRGGAPWWSGRGGFCRVVFGQQQKPWRQIVFGAKRNRLPVGPPIPLRTTSGAFGKAP